MVNWNSYLELTFKKHFPLSKHRLTYPKNTRFESLLVKQLHTQNTITFEKMIKVSQNTNFSHKNIYDRRKATVG